METTAADGKRYQTNYYNLDAIIALGYRVNSKKATMFRIWANRVLKGFIIKGYAMDDARLREPENFFDHHLFLVLQLFTGSCWTISPAEKPYLKWLSLSSH